MSSTFPSGVVLTPPKPTLAKTYQIGTVMKFRRWTLDADSYYIHFQNGYQILHRSGDSGARIYRDRPPNTKGFEAESNIVIGWGLSAYANVSAGTAKYQTGANYPNGGLWVANAPNNVEGLSLLWRHKNWDVGFHRQARRPACTTTTAR